MLHCSEFYLLLKAERKAEPPAHSLAAEGDKTKEVLQTADVAVLHKESSSHHLCLDVFICCLFKTHV